MIARVGATLLVLALLAIPAGAQVTPEDLAAAEARISELFVEINGITAEYQAAIERGIRLGDEIDVLENQVAARQVEVAELRDRVKESAVRLYVEAAGTGAATILAASSPGEADARSQYLSDVGALDQALINSLEITSRALDDQALVLADARSEQAAAAEELDALAADVSARLEAAQSEYDALLAEWQEQERRRIAEEERRRAEEEARRRAEEEARNATTTTTVADTPADEGEDPPDTTTTTAPPTDAPTSGPAMTCPIDGFTSFTDTWGAPRSGGRFHQGVDMLSARGTPVVAVTAGSVKRMGNGGLGGITVWIRADNGDEFYYAHLDAWASGLTSGQSVVAGTPLGTVGTTGNAPANIPHLHWEYHPGGGGAVNPTPLANSLCG